MNEPDAHPATGPLTGLRVLDFSRLLPGPLCTLHLADLGADVIKIEDPTAGGDYARTLPPMQRHQSYLYNLINRNKRSCAVAYRTPEGQALIYKLVQKADVVVESFRPGAMAAWGLSYDDLRAHNPGLVYCSITGFGQTGPLANAAGHDVNYEALAGVLDQIGPRGGAPVIPNFQLADIVGGSLMAAIGILSAVVGQKLTGQGRYIDCAMLDGLAANAAILQSTTAAMGQAPARGADILSGAMPFYSLYETLDGRFMALGALEFKFWERFCRAVDRPDLLNQHMVFGNDADRVRADLAALFATQTQAHWTAHLAPHDCCCTPVLTLNEALAQPHAQARHLAHTVTHPTEGPLTHVAMPLHMTGYKFTVRHPAPTLGQHTQEVLSTGD